ncbi:universal stress protein [Rhodanobacter caeni]|uniref:Universal stress protein n=1 Tax=Rhodanobacter caeni TaxID=657654 RepID=A0ABN0UAW6_9GAMM
MNATASSLAPPQKILLATDLRSHGDRALDRAAQLALQWGVPLHVVHVQPCPGEDELAPLNQPSWRPGRTSPIVVERQIRRDLRQDVAALAIHVVDGDPAEAILDVAAQQACNLIVLGASEPSSPSALGRVTEQLLRKSPVSLLVVKSRPHGAYANVVVGTDFTDESRCGLTTAASWLPDARLTLMHVLDIPYTSLWLDAEHSTGLARMEMATMRSFLDSTPLAVEVRARVLPLIEHGHPEIVLRDHVVQEESDLVVISAFRRGLAFHLLVGGTSRRIVPAVPSDVLLVRAQP